MCTFHAAGVLYPVDAAHLQLDGVVQKGEGQRLER